jgi:hypothetical protein
MKAITRFTFADHQGPGATDPDDRQLLADGQPTALRVPGRVLRKQYETRHGYLLFTELDYWIEEAVFVVLVDKSLQRIVAQRLLNKWYSSYSLDAVEWQDDEHFYLTIEGLAEYRFYFTVRRFTIPLIRPRLGIACRRFHPGSGQWRRDIR